MLMRMSRSRLLVMLQSVLVPWVALESIDRSLRESWRVVVLVDGISQIARTVCRTILSTIVLASDVVVVLRRRRCCRRLNRHLGRSRCWRRVVVVATRRVVVVLRCV